MRFLLAIVFVTMLFVAGCPGGAPQEGAQTGEAPADQPTESAPSQPGTAPGTAPSEQEPAGQETQQEGSPFDSWDMQAMMEMGQPVHCTVTMNEEGMSYTSEMWFKGENMRVETSTSSGGEAYMGTVIIKNDVMYMSQQEGYGMGEMEDCDWQMLDSKELEACMPESEEPTETGTFDVETYEATPSEYHCEYGTFGDEKFATPGKVCDLTQQLCDMYEMMESEAFPGMGADMCEGLTGQEYADCMEAVSQYQ
jgi:hypothetical protein